MRKFINKYILPNTLPLTLILSYVVLVFFTNPFFKIPFDMWEMLMRIESIFYTGKDFTFFPARIMTKYHLWPWLWAQIFKFFNINDPFAWPYIIHVTQTLILSASLFFFCWVVLGVLLPKNKYRLTLAFFSMIFWIFGNGTFSVQYQQAWIMWYSVNYQCISMSILWLNLGLTLLVLYSDISLRKKIVLSLIIPALFILALFFHSMEMGFYLMFLIVLACFKIKKFPNLKNIKRRNLLLLLGSGLPVFILLFICAYLIINGTIYAPWKDHLSKISQVSDLFHLLNIYSGGLIRGLNRFPNSFSELAIFSLGWGVIMSFNINKITTVVPDLHKRLFFAILTSATLFFFIPVIPGLNGLFALLTHSNVVYRFFYVSPWFLFVPIGIYLMMAKKDQNRGFCNQKLIFISSAVFLSVVLLSKSLPYSFFYRNCKSTFDSFEEKSVGCQYSREDIERLKKLITKEGKKAKGLTPLYYIRGDWGSFLAVIPKVYVYNYNRITLPNFPNVVYYRQFVKLHKNKSEDKNWKDYKRYHIYVDILKDFEGFEVINIEFPANFPRDEKIFEEFPLLERPYDKVVIVEKANSFSGGISSNQEIIQSLKPVGRVARIQLCFHKPEKATKDVFLKVQEKESSKTFAELKINASEIRDKKWHTFKFPDYVYLNPKKTYYLVLESPESYPGNSVSVYLGDGKQYKNGELYINGKKTGMDLCMKIWKGY